MNQDLDLIEWLKTTKAEEEENNLLLLDNPETELLLAPLDSAQPDSEIENNEDNLSDTENTSQIAVPETVEESTSLSSEDDISPCEGETLSETEESKPDVKNLDEWHEAATKFDLSLDEPPIEIWTQIRESIEDDDEDYEQSMSLQGDAYIQLPTEHGKNFTQRLHKTLKDRQKKAEDLRKEEELEKRNQHPYTLKSIILCSVLVIEVAISCFILFVLNRHAIAKKQNEIKEHHEIEIILPKLEEKESKDVGVEKIKEIKIEGDSKDLKIIESNDESKLEESEFESEPGFDFSNLPTNFEDLVNEGNSAYNFELYDMSILIFHKAIELKNNDIRPYIGLIRSYRAKKMYFDAKRILDVARIKFGRNPTLETELKILLLGERKKNERKHRERK